MNERSRIATMALWALPVVGALTLLTLAAHLTEFSYGAEGAWISAQNAVIARMFVEHGIFSLHGVGVQNNDPITSEPDLYTHWPPFFYYFLCAVMRIFGESVRALHLAMALASIGTGVMLGLVASRTMGRNAGLACTGTFLLLPVTVSFGMVLVALNLGLFELAVAMWAGLEYATGNRSTGYLWGSGCFLMLACLTTWEPFLALPGLGIASLLDGRPRIRRLFWVLCGSGFLAATITFAVYAIGAPDSLRELWTVFLYRAGLHSYTPVVHVHTMPTEGAESTIWWGQIVLWLTERPFSLLGGVGWIGLVFAIFDPVRNRGKLVNTGLFQIILPFISMWVLWALLMRKQYEVQAFELLLAAPLAALGIAALVSSFDKIQRLLPAEEHRYAVGLLAYIAVPIVLLGGAAQQALATYVGAGSSRELITFGHLIEHTVPENGIVVTDETNLVHLWYSHRHTISAIPNGEALAEKLDGIRGLCSTCKVFLAIRRESAPAFARQLDHVVPLFSDDKFIVAPL